ncbi:MAG: hypothetical protein U0575_07775 [Phycisphaerales bacterium]|jgi:hypothetical protein
MHERRNFVLVLLTIAFAVWGIVAWFLFGESLTQATTTAWASRWLALGAIAVAGGLLAYALLAEDKLPDHLAEVVGPVYYEVDGLCFMPMVRSGRDSRAELCIYYQNRFENPVNAVVHLRPPQDSFVIKEGMRDAHFAFRASGGDFGCIRQPIAVPTYLQGEVVEVDLAAACHYQRGQGARLRRKPGMKCGTLSVDWGGAAFKTGVHEVSGEIELKGASAMHLCMPTGVKTRLGEKSDWRQEQIAAGVV